MLVLTRQRTQQIRIGHDIVITIVDIRGDKVRIGIDAPKLIDVNREEVYRAIVRENERAAAVRLPRPHSLEPVPATDLPDTHGGADAGEED